MTHPLSCFMEEKNLANSEDYLDGLLNSVNTVRSDVKKAEEIAEESRKQRDLSACQGEEKTVY